MNINCLNNKIANTNSVLKPIILQAIREIYLNGNHQMTARMVKNQCIILDANILWDKKNPTVCNSMRNSIECGGRIIGEDRDFNDFTIAFDVNGNNLNIPTPKSKSTIKKKKATSQPKKTSDMSITKQEELILSKNFKVVMVCAGTKNDSFFTSYPDENFVNEAEQNFEHHPDDLIPGKKITWREYLENNQDDTNLKMAFKLYLPIKYRDIYSDLYKKFKTNFYILSAGWGLVKSEFKLPKYDISFSASGNKKRKVNINKPPIYNDFNQLEVSCEDDIVYVGGEKYLNLFYKLTQNLPNRKIIYYNTQTQPKANNGNYIYIRYIINYTTNWYYQLAKDLCNL